MLSFKVGYRFFISKNIGPLATFMSFSSTVGIALGVMALITGLSCMNGFEYELENRVLSIIPNAYVKSENDYFRFTEQHVIDIEKGKYIKAVAPAVEIPAIISNYKDFVPIQVIGIDPIKEKKIINIDKFLSNSLDSLNKKENKDDAVNIILGLSSAKKLNVKVGDTLVLYTSNSVSTAILTAKQATKLKVAGLLTIGGSLDSLFAFINIDDAKEIAKLKGANAIHIKTKNLLNAKNEALDALSNFNEPASLYSWMQIHGKLYNDIIMIRQIMYLAMFLVMAVACFNIISNLVMSVNEKKKEIAILLTLGMKRSSIIKSFSFMGFLSGLLGTSIGTILGIGFSSILTDFTTFLKEKYGIVLLNEDIYFISFIPSKIDVVDVVSIVLCALTMSILAAIYPAIKAAKIYPVKEL